MCGKEDSHEEGQHSLVSTRVAPRVEDGQEDQANAAGHGKDSGHDRQEFLPVAVVHGKAALVAQPSLGNEDAVKADDHDGRACDEQRLSPCRRAESGNVHDMLAGIGPIVVLAVTLRGPYGQHGDECACSPSASLIAANDHW